MSMGEGWGGGGVWPGGNSTLDKHIVTNTIKTLENLHAHAHIQSQVAILHNFTGHING